MNSTQFFFINYKFKFINNKKRMSTPAMYL